MSLYRAGVLVRALLVALAPVFIFAGVVLSAQAAAAQGPPANVMIAPVVSETVERWRLVTGELVARRRSILAAEQGGMIQHLNVDIGDAVAVGQVVASLDTQLKELDIERLRAIVETRQAAVLVRKNQRDFAARDLSRVEESAAERSIPPTELDQFRTRLAETEAQMAEAQADVRSAQAALSLAERELEKMHIRAPFAGRVSAKRAEIGQWAAVGDPIVELIDMQSIEARLDVPERYVSRLRAAVAGSNGGAWRGVGDSDRDRSAMTAAAVAASDHATTDIVLQIPAFQAEQNSRIVAISPQADPLSRLVGVRAAVSNPDEMIKPGMRVTGSVPSGEIEPHVLIPKDAVLRDDAGTFVYVVIPAAPGGPAGGPPAQGGPPGPAFQAMPMRVEIIFATGSRVAIRAASISVGMHVVIEGNERLYPTQALNILNPEVFDPPSLDRTDMDQAELDQADAQPAGLNDNDGDSGTEPVRGGA